MPPLPRALPPLLVLWVAVPRALGGRNPPADIPAFEIDLDKPPRLRWQHVGRHFRPWIKDHLKVAQLDVHGGPWSDEEFDDLIKIAGFPEELSEEIWGIVESVDLPEITHRNLLKQQVLYELGFTQGFACAGIVAAKADGTVVHGRNFDLSAEARDGNALTIEVVFVKGGRAIARGPSWFGFVGMHTGVRLHEGWSIEANTRYGGVDFGIWYDTSKGWSENYRAAWREAGTKAIQAGGKFQQLEGRRVLLEMDTFADAVAALAMTPWAAPQYWILSGAGKSAGAVITADRTGMSHSEYEIQMLNAAAGEWFIVQTNDDHWKKPYDNRRKSAAHMMKKVKDSGRGFDEAIVMRTLRSQPVCVPGTLFTWVCNPTTEEEQFDMGECL